MKPEALTPSPWFRHASAAPRSPQKPVRMEKHLRKIDAGKANIPSQKRLVYSAERPLAAFLCFSLTHQSTLQLRWISEITNSILQLQKLEPGQPCSLSGMDRTVVTAAWQSSSISTLRITLLHHLFTFIFNDPRYWEILLRIKMCTMVVSLNKNSLERNPHHCRTRNSIVLS